MDKITFETPDLVAGNIEKIAALFPNCITEALDEARSTAEKKVYKKVVNFEVLKQMLSGEVLEGDEAYQFTWVGKKAAMVEANRPIRKTLLPCPEESKDWDTTQNLYIEGDNLEVLKLLQESYLGAVKMIYIDPPYNTGNDFIYRDDFAMDTDEYEKQLGMYDEETGERLFRNTDSNGRFHSDWCSMIYSRLLLANSFLAPDGVIAISINYLELHNLMKICQEVFHGKQVFAVTVQTSGGKPNGAFSISNEYLVFIVSEGFIPASTEEDMKDSASPYHGMNLATFNQVQRPNQVYPIFVDSDGAIVGCGKTLQERINDGSYVGEVADYKYDYNDAPEGTCAIWPITAKGDQCVWRLIPQRLLGDWKKGYIKVIPQKADSKNKYVIQYLSGGIIEKIESGEFHTIHHSDRPNIPTLEIIDYKTAGTVIQSVWTDNNFYTTKGGNDIRELFGGKVFSYPKPMRLLYYIFQKTTSNGDIILDFFSGSATTAHAVMQLNAEDGGHRKFIMVQLPEKCDESSEAYKAGYRTICDIGKERIRRAGDKIQASLREDGLAIREMGSYQNKFGTLEGFEYAEWTESPDVISAKERMADSLDIGFRVFRVADPNTNDVYLPAADYDQTMLVGMESNLRDDRTDLDLLFGCLLDWGLPLSLPYSSESIDGCTVHTYNDGDLIACFDANVPESVIETIAKRQPLRAVFRDSSFSTSPAKINVTEIFKYYAPDTRVKVI